MHPKNNGVDIYVRVVHNLDNFLHDVCLSESTGFITITQTTLDFNSSGFFGFFSYYADKAIMAANLWSVQLRDASQNYGPINKPSVVVPIASGS